MKNGGGRGDSGGKGNAFAVEGGQRAVHSYGPATQCVRHGCDGDNLCTLALLDTHRTHREPEPSAQTQSAGKTAGGWQMYRTACVASHEATTNNGQQSHAARTASTKNKACVFFLHD